ncbi:MAG: TIGR02300 family protein [Alphaproteobacteria bacterium]|nr:TIGR02300 family protein [Alphaproteobacteria bacterium]
MVSAELGQKRRCFSCGMKFYDFNKSPITCPECGSEFDPENLLKSRRGKTAVKAAVVKPEAAAEDDLEGESETKDDEFDESDNVADDDDLPSDDETFIPAAGEDGDETTPDIESGELIDVLDDNDGDNDDEQ